MEAMEAMTSVMPMAGPWGALPPRMKILYITTLQRTGGALAESLAVDNVSEVSLEEAVGITAGLARLRDEVFDAVLITHEPGVLSAIELVEGLRAGGAEEPMIVLGNLDDAHLAVLCYEVGADAYLNALAVTPRTLIWTLGRAIERYQVFRENRRLVQAERQRLRQEHREAERLLSQQRAVIDDLEALRESRAGADDGSPAKQSGGGDEAQPGLSPAASCLLLPEPIVAQYREMLKAYVIMGTGNLTSEMAALADLLVSTGVTAQETMNLHVHVLEELIRGLGNRSTRHVMNRADLLALEMIVHLADGYRERYVSKRIPCVQMMIPGLDNPCESRD